MMTKCLLTYAPELASQLWTRFNLEIKDMKLGSLSRKYFDFLFVKRSKEKLQSESYLLCMLFSRFGKGSSVAHPIDHLHRVLVSEVQQLLLRNRIINWSFPSAIVSLVFYGGRCWGSWLYPGTTVFNCLIISWGRQIISCPGLSSELADMNLYFHFCSHHRQLWLAHQLTCIYFCTCWCK